MQGVLKHSPNYVPFETRPDGGGRQGAKINIDTTFIGDAQSVMSIQAAVNSSAAMDDSFITFAPILSDAGYDSGRQVYGASAYVMAGASMGLATTAAILGQAPLPFTGFMRAPSPDMRFMPGSKWSGQGNVVEVAKSGGLIETVNGIVYKVRWALDTGVPLIMPYYNEFFLPLINADGSPNLGPELGQDKRQFLIRSAQQAAYSAQDMTDGVPCTRGKMLYVAKSILDACMLSSLAFAAQVRIPDAAAELRQRGTNTLNLVTDLYAGVLRGDARKKEAARAKALGEKQFMQEIANLPEDQKEAAFRERQEALATATWNKFEEKKQQKMQKIQSKTSKVAPKQAAKKMPTKKPKQTAQQAKAAKAKKLKESARGRAITKLSPQSGLSLLGTMRGGKIDSRLMRALRGESADLFQQQAGAAALSGPPAGATFTTQ
jgi:hypothetical protein